MTQPVEVFAGDSPAAAGVTIVTAGAHPHQEVASPIGGTPGGEALPAPVPVGEHPAQVDHAYSSMIPSVLAAA